MSRVLVFVVAYNAESTLTDVLRRIPRKLFAEHDAEVLVIDDASTDETFRIGEHVRRAVPELPLTVLKNPENLGYGGNQKLGYQYAIREGFEYVILLHGDGQYAPEEIPNLLDRLIECNCAAVFGSRMMVSTSALKGGMPLYKFVGNRILTAVQNWLTGLQLSEWHSGYRLYSVEALRRIPFERNSDDFDFDTEIILQLHLADRQIAELPVPTFYGDEVCHVNGVNYALQIVIATVLSRLSRMGILHDPRFEVAREKSNYQPKFGFPSTHRMALDAVRDGERLLILGCGPLETTLPFASRTDDLVIVDRHITGEHLLITRNAVQADLNNLTADDIGEAPFDCVLLMDVLEHLQDPEALLTRLRRFRQCKDARFILTTPNVVFLPLRLMFALGQFNYGTRGILDKTHSRLFTFSSFRRMLNQQGFTTLKLQGVPAPFPLALGCGWLSRLLLAMNRCAVALLPKLFSYQIYCEARPRPTVEHLLAAAETHAEQLREPVTV